MASLKTRLRYIRRHKRIALMHYSVRVIFKGYFSICKVNTCNIMPAKVHPQDIGAGNITRGTRVQLRAHQLSLVNNDSLRGRENCHLPDVSITKTKDINRLHGTLLPYSLGYVLSGDEAGGVSYVN